MSENRNYTQRQYPKTQKNITAMRKRAARRRKLFFRKMLLCAAALTVCVILLDKILALPDRKAKTHAYGAGSGTSRNQTETDPETAQYLDAHGAELPQELQKLLELNPETLDYVKGYPDRETYTDASIDLSGDFVRGQVPLLMQWDKRWGYDSYGDSMIGLAGCGPLCLNMAYLYFTEDTDLTPREMAEFAYECGFYTPEGTSWSLWTEGARALGLNGQELPLDENRMRRALDGGSLIVCSMGPGDFTTTGHFILIRGYDENGFYVNDPNRRSNSEKQWDYETLKYQIRNLWELSGPHAALSANFLMRDYSV